MQDPADFVSDTFLDLFHRGVALLQTGSDPAALEDVMKVEGVTQLVFEGGATLWLLTREGSTQVVDGPGDHRVRASIAVPVEAARRWLSEIVLGEDLSGDEAALVAARSMSARADAAIGDDPLLFHLVLADAPELGDVRVRIGLGASDPPEEPRFTATVGWEDLRRARTEGRSVQDLFMGGQIRLGGDYSRAMAVALQLLQDS
ncbi:MAG: hypothetical protein AAGF12_14760 [Myxococcota bacterium]